VPTIAFTLEDVRYTVPSEDEDSLETILSSGILATIEHGWITISGTRVAFPVGLPDGGFCYTVETFPVCFMSRFSDGGGDGGGGHKSECDIPKCAPLDLICIGQALFNTFKCVAKAAAGAIEGIAGFGGVMLGHAFSASTAIAGEITEEVEPDARAAMNAAERAVNRTEQSFEEFEVQEMAMTEALTAAGPLTGAAAEFAAACRAINPSSIRIALNLIRNLWWTLRLIVRGVTRGLRTVLSKLLSDVSVKYLLGIGSSVAANLADGGVMGAALVTLGAIVAGTGVLPKREASKRLYFIQTDFDPKEFDPFVAFISDGTGDKIAVQWNRPSTGPCYFGRLDKWIAAVLPGVDKVTYVELHRNGDEEAAYQDFMGGDGSLLFGPQDIPVASSDETEDDEPEGALLADLLGESWNLTLPSSLRQEDDDPLVIRPDDWDHNMVLAWRKGMALDQQESIWRESQGEGVTIFMLGAGADVVANGVRCAHGVI
jgi:hypothetical protein